jgi:hypothetical protein
MGGEWFAVDGKRLLLAGVRLKNIGASVVELLQKGIGLRVSTLGDDEHAWIEPGETVADGSRQECADLPVVARGGERAQGRVRRTGRRWSTRAS